MKQVNKLRFDDGTIVVKCELTLEEIKLIEILQDFGYKIQVQANNGFFWIKYKYNIFYKED